MAGSKTTVVGNQGVEPRVSFRTLDLQSSAVTSAARYPIVARMSELKLL